MERKMSKSQKNKKKFVFDETHFDLNVTNEQEDEESADAFNRITAKNLNFYSKEISEQKKNNSKNKSKNKENVHDGHRDRMYDIFINKGFDSFSDIEKLELILYCAVPRGDTNILAHQLMENFGSIKNVLNADVRDLTTIKGISKAIAVKIRIFKEVTKYLDATLDGKYDDLTNSREIGKYCVEQFGEKTVEYFYLMSLDSNRKIKCINQISKGDETSTAMPYDEIIRYALFNKAKNVILCHNHPLGGVNPSSNDLYETIKIREIMSALKINVVDHIICDATSYLSFAERGLLDKKNLV